MDNPTQGKPIPLLSPAGRAAEALDGSWCPVADRALEDGASYVSTTRDGGPPRAGYVAFQCHAACLPRYRADGSMRYTDVYQAGVTYRARRGL